MRSFLAAVWGPLDGLYGELRFIRDRCVEQRWVEGSADGFSPSLCNAMDTNGWDAYYGVLPRRRRSGAAADTVEETSVPWADVDAKSHPSKVAALYSLTEYAVPPSAIVDSGGGYHAYWFLDQPVPFVLAREAMRHISKGVGGDSVYDAARVLRIPDTHNHKSSPPVRVRLLQMDTLYRHRLDDFVWRVQEKRRPREAAARTTAAAMDLPAWLTAMIRDGAPKGNRSETAFKVAVWMLRYGCSHDDVIEAFRTSPAGIGAKYYEKGRDGDRWLAITLAAAEDAGE